MKAWVAGKLKVVAAEDKVIVLVTSQALNNFVNQNLIFIVIPQRKLFIFLLKMEIEVIDN